MKPLVVIPARGGSKRVPGKNIKILGGKPLVYYTIETARKIFPDEQIFVSTDSEEIKSCVEKTGLKVPFLRTKDLASDTASTQSVLLHAVLYAESSGYSPDTLILLQPTSPFRTEEHIHEAIKLFDEETEMVVSVKQIDQNLDLVLRKENKDGWLVRINEISTTTKQNHPKIYEYNGSIYIINVDSLKNKPIEEFIKVRKYLMDELFSLDIDNWLDWKMAEAMINCTSDK